MQVFNADETGVSIVHRQGKVFVQLGQRHISSITSAVKGKIHTLLCVSAAGKSHPQ